MDGLSDTYHVPFTTRLHGTLDRAALEKSMGRLFSRHESLRSVFVVVDGAPQVRLLSADDDWHPLAVHDLRGQHDRETATIERLSHGARAPFDLTKGPVVRSQLIQLSDTENIFQITMHHIVTDGWSMDVMVRELNALYNAYSAGQPDPLTPLAIQYPDYAAWQRQQLTEDKLQLQTTYWRENLAGVPVSIELPTDRPRPPQQSFVGASIPIRLDRDLAHNLNALSRKHGVTMFMTVLAAWSAVLSRLSGQEDIVIGTPSANRGHPQVEQLIGFFVSTLALRIDLSDEPTVKQLLERVRKTTIAAQAHQDIPFEQVVEIVRPPRRTDISPIFQVMMAWQNNDVDEIKLHDIQSVYEDQQYDVAKFDLDLSLGEIEGEIVGSLNYSTAIFDRETIERHVGYLEAMIRWMVTDVEGCVGLAPIVGPIERELLLKTWNTTEAPYPDNSCVHTLFEIQVDVSPEAIAIVHGEQSLTYRDLNSRANWIAQQLVKAGAEAGDYVMLLFDRSIDLVASQIAVLKAGAAYVPLDTNAPLERQAYMVSDCGSTILITDDNPSSDPSTFEVWSALLHGARLLIVDTNTVLDANLLESAVLRHRVTALFLTSAIFHRHVFVIGRTLSNLKYLLGGGEQAATEAYATIMRHGGSCKIINAYGPTETTVDATTFTVQNSTSDPSNLTTIPIGKPISNTKVYVLDKYGEPVPLGVVGELYIGGPGVANGYLNLPELTAERFIPDPFNQVPNARMYKTGDLVRYLPDGNLVFLGRNDNQVKIRGFRIELGEIESRLTEHPKVREALVVVVEKESDDKRLVAYVVAEHENELVQTLRQHLSNILPEYMVPSAFVCMDAFPLTNNGKIDRRALPEPTSESLSTSEYIAPQGELEMALAAIWSDLLKIERIGRHDNFFMLGGHSLMAVRLMNCVSNLGVTLPLSTLFAHPTVATLATAVSCDDHLESTHSRIIPVTRESPLELSYAQQRLWFLTQLNGLSEIYHVPFATRLHGSLDRAALEQTMSTLFARHESLRSVFVSVNGEPQVRLLSADNGFPLAFQDVSGKSDKEALVKELVKQHVGTPFDLINGPLIRAMLIQLAKCEHVLLITIHHIVIDGWSMGIMFRELNALYNAYSTRQPDPLNPLPIQYPDYAAWQKQQLTEDKLQAQSTYWHETLAGVPVSIELPIDRPRPPQQSVVGASVPIHLDRDLTHGLNSLSRKHGVTMFMTVLAAWSAVLSRLSGQEDIVIGTPSANRGHPQLEQLIGFFVSTLALRIDLSDEPSTKQLLERVRKTTVEAQAHQDLPFEQVVEIVRPPRRADISPIFQVMMAWQNNNVDELQLRGIESVYEDQQYNVAKFELSLSLGEKDGEIVGGMNYSTAIFDRETIERHVGYLEAMLRWMVADIEESISMAPILGPSERELLLETWNATEAPYPDNVCIHEIFESQVERSSGDIAIVQDDQELTYCELNSMANWIAQKLTDAGVQLGDYVMLLLDRSIDLIASQLAVLKVGAAYVPIDTNAPMDRQRFIASDCGSTVIITSGNKVVPDEIQATVLRLNADANNNELVK
ncbi:hypothetical protein BG004_003455, partial [Podila humilis]